MRFWSRSLPLSALTLVLVALGSGPAPADTAQTSTDCEATLVLHGTGNSLTEWVTTPPNAVLRREEKVLGDRLAIPVLSRGCAEVRGTVASPSGEFAPTRFEVPADILRAGGLAEVHALPAPGWSIRVVDVDGGPISNARVRPWMIARDLTVRTDDNGVASGPHGTHSYAVIKVRADGFRTQFARFPEDATPLEVVLQTAEPFEVTFSDPPQVVTESAAVGPSLFKAECALEAPGRFICPETGAWPQQVVVRCGGGTAAARPRHVSVEYGSPPPFVWCGPSGSNAPKDDTVDPPSPWPSTDLAAEVRVKVLTEDGAPAEGWSLSTTFLPIAETNKQGTATLRMPFEDSVLLAGPMDPRSPEAGQLARVQMSREDWASQVVLRAKRICQYVPHLEPDGAGAWVQSVPAGSGPWEAGLRPGDRVLEVAGTPVAGLTRDAVRSLLFLPHGTHITLSGVRWGGEPAEWTWVCE